MRLAVLCSPTSWYCGDLQRAAGRDYEVVPLPFSSIASAVAMPWRSATDPRSICSRDPEPDSAQGSGAVEESATTVISQGQELTAFDVVLVRTMPFGTLEQVIFRMDALARHEANGGVVINPTKAIELAVDKYLSLSRLQAAGLPVPPTYVCQTAEDAMAAFEQFGGDVVIKPLFGSEGRGITRVSDPALALRAFKLLSQLGSVIYLQQFIPHRGYDIRVMVIGERMLGMIRRNPDDWRTNVSLGASTKPFDLDAIHENLARRAVEVVGTPLAGVDILHGPDGQHYVLEVNAVPGWKALSKTLEVDVGRIVLDHLAAS